MEKQETKLRKRTSSEDWRLELQGLSTEGYLASCIRIPNIDYGGYLTFEAKSDCLTRRQAHKNWTDTIDRLLGCTHAGLVRKGEEQRQKWDNNTYRQLDNMHWALQSRKHAAELQSVTVTRMADASVNKKMKRMLEEEVDAQYVSSSSACRTPPYNQGFSLSSPEPSSQSPPAPPTFVPQKGTQDVASHAFFTSGGSLQDIFLDNLREGHSLPSWAKDRPSYTFELQLQESWGPRVTELYNMAKTKADLDHTHVDEIALLSGILYFNQNHVGFSAKEMANISAQVLQNFYSQDMEDKDMQRAAEAVVQWTSWVQIWKSTSLKEKLAAQKDARDVREVNTELVIDAIMSSYTDCKNKNILSIVFIALHVFRRYNNWAHLVSESDCMMAVVGPFLQEVMDVQHEIKFTCANASTSAGKARKSSLRQDGQSRQPDIVGQARDAREVFYGELKGLNPSLAAVNTDMLRLAIFTKDALDQLHKTLEQGPPLLTFQTVGRDVTFFLGAKIDNTIVHAYLSSVKLPSLLSELDLDLEFFFRLFQVQTLVAIANSRLKNKRDKPLQDVPFPTLGTPQRNAALNTPQKNKKLWQ
ncbi:hypothetical protein BGX28_010003 [Mortierella sp. GBA30]|nr:hypothetical protein BGX28_010003 [Mortierella sp. GBA30]